MTIKESKELKELASYVGTSWRQLRMDLIGKLQEDRVLYDDDDLTGWTMEQIFAEEGIPLVAACKIYLSIDTIRACMLFSKLELEKVE